MPLLFGAIRKRYLERPGGYTRVLRTEPIKEDQADSAILELVDGPKDMRFAMTAKTLARISEREHRMNEITAKNVKKVTQFRADGMKELRSLVAKMKHMGLDQESKEELPEKRRVYPEEKHRREMHIP
jgi:large subunit ribosomal protein L17